jgi:arginase
VDIAITNVQLDLGAGRRGTDMGPSAMHVAGLVPRLKRIGHHITSVESVGTRSAENTNVGDPQARFLDAIRAVCSDLADRVHRSVDAGHMPLVLGGDHAQAIGTISGLARHYLPRGERIGVLWVDAHTDMNTPNSSPSGNIHGMPLASLLGHGLPELMALGGTAPVLRPEDVVIIGARDIDPTEIPLVRETGVRVYTMSELDSRGTNVCFQEALERVLDGTAGVHLSFDLDGVDPREAPGVGTPVPGGLTLRESHLLCEMVSRSGKMLGMEMVELNPTLDVCNKTGELAVWLIMSAMGKTIL